MLSRCSPTRRVMYVVLILFICSSEPTRRGRKSASAEQYERGQRLVALAGEIKYERSSCEDDMSAIVRACKCISGC